MGQNLRFGSLPEKKNLKHSSGYFPLIIHLVDEELFPVMSLLVKGDKSLLEVCH